MYNYITPSLLNSWLYLTTNEYAKLEDFLDTLSKVKKPQTPAMLKGIEFENECYAGQHEHMQKYIKGGIYQLELRKMYKGILIYGFLDCLNYDTIYDIKTTKSYELGKYYNTSQHKIYCYCLGLEKFEYLIETPGGFYTEPYTYKQGQAEQLIDEFIEWLKVTNLYEIWKNKWVRE